ncbi:MAG: hypothetical protein MI975_04220 [Cytophagales bacterium]|nr:hypothetical protein [Cytophagales bacterium]
MKISVEISYYPLKEDYIKPIGAFIERLHTYEALVVRISGISTHIFGEYKDVMGAITNEIETSFEVPHSVFVLKIINADLQEIPD